jgi:SnoaL-like domain
MGIQTQIDDLLARYCFTVDHAEWDCLRADFAPDATICYSGPTICTGIEATIAFFRYSTRGLGATRHLSHTCRFRRHSQDQARAKTYVTVHHLAGGGMLHTRGIGEPPDTGPVVKHGVYPAQNGIGEWASL